MARFRGKIGYIITHEKEDQPGVWISDEIEVSYRGEVLKRASNWQGETKINEDVNITNRISIVADPFAYANYPYIRYVVLGPVKWEVTDITVDRPRIVLTLGGVYNGSQA